MMQASFVKGFSSRFGLNPINVLKKTAALSYYEQGKKFSILFGDPEHPDFHIEVFQNMNRIDLTFVEDDEDREKYIALDGALYADYPRDELFLNTYTLRVPGSQQRELDLFFSDAFAHGDFPRFSTAGPPPAIHAVAADFSACWLGPKPSFEELCDGRFVERLPKIERPPEALLDPFIPQDQRTSRTPKRTPRGVYPSGEKRVHPGFLAERTG